VAEIQLKSNRFREERETDWRRLEVLLGRAERQGIAALRKDEILELPVLYQQALSSLSVARSISLDQALVDYLESLCTRAYFFVYGTRTRIGERVAGFFLREWPMAAQALWRETLVALSIGVIGTVVAFLLVRSDPDWFYGFVQAELANGRDPTATTAFLRETLYPKVSVHEGLSAMSAFLFTHNSQVALFAFALGFALCLPTAALLLYNGCMLGAFLALFASRKLGIEAGGWLMIHGVTELFAITLAGAAGLSLGWSVAFPGERTRVDAAAHAGRRAAMLMAGVVVMLFCAGLLEGFARQLIRADWARYSVAATTGVLWCAYFYWPRRRRT
jgi:uncharacterized membrane protein SpoIIM required for sporulation